VPSSLCEPQRGKKHFAIALAFVLCDLNCSKWNVVGVLKGFSYSAMLKLHDLIVVKYVSS
jgi:hypothetical protein